MRLNVTELYELQLRKTPIVVCAYAPNSSVEYPASSWSQWVGKRYRQETLVLLTDFHAQGWRNLEGAYWEE